MNLLLKKIVFLWMAWVWMSICIAATDNTALTNNLAALPGIQSQTQGYDFISGKVTQNIPLVKGPIPFTMQYHASLRLSSDGGVDYYQELDEGAVADWSNEYSGYIITNPTPGTNGERAFIIQLPGSYEKYIIAYMGGKWKRIYYSGSGAAPAQTFTSEDLRDISFSEINGVVIIIKDGVTYTAGISKNLSSFGKTDKLLKFTSIKFQDGKLLTLSYDNGVNLIQVKDNRNNILKILRDYKKAGATSQSALERKLITGVELVSGNSTQKSTISYQETQVKSIVDLSKQETRYTLVGIQSLVAGKFSYQYNNLLRGYLYKYLFNNVSGRTQDELVDASTYPMLTKVLDEKNNVLREWDYADIVEVYSGTAAFKIYATQITSFTIVNGVPVNKSKSYYDDMKELFTNRFVVNGQEQAVDVSIDSSKLGSYYNEANLSLMAGATATVTLSGNFPSIMNGSVPVKSVTFNPFTHRIVSIKDFNGNTSKYDYDSLNRLSKSTLALDTVDAQITTYNYNKLTTGGVNRFPTPNEIITDSQKVTNTIDENGWINQQVISYPKGGATKTFLYTYYTDSSKADYGLLKNVDGPRSDVDDNISVTYDKYGNKLTSTQTVNNRAVVTKYLNYNSFGQPERVISPSGIVDQYIYNLDGTLKSKTTGSGGDVGNISGAITSYTYDYLKRKKTETNSDNETTTYDYDILGRVIKTILPNDNINVQSYYDNGVIKSIEGVSSIYNEINTQGRISRSGKGLNKNYFWNDLTYDGNGNLIQSQSTLGVIEKWTYDALNRNITYTDGEGKISTKTYDKSNNLLSTKDPVNSGSIPFNYINGKLIKDEVNFDYSTKSYTYNQSDQITSKVHGSRKCVYSNIDVLGRIGSISCNSEHDGDPAYDYNYQYSYDSSRFGQLDKVSSSSSFGVETFYSYDNLGRVNEKTQINKALATWGGVNSPLVVSYNYSLAGKVLGIKMPSGRIVKYNYESSKDKLNSLEIDNNIFFNVSYDEMGRVNKWVYNPRIYYSFGYDSSNSGVLRSTAFSIPSEWFSFGKHDFTSVDNDGKVTMKMREFDSYIYYKYDKVGRLLSENLVRAVGDYDVTQYKFDYTYDSNGNRKTFNVSGGKAADFTSLTNAIYNYTYNRLSSLKRNSVDANLNYLQQGELRLNSFLSGYDGMGMMRYSGGANAQYYMAYNHKNERTIRSSSNLGSWYTGAVQFVYDEDSKLIGEYTPDGKPIVEYVWVGNRLAASIYGDVNATKIYAVYSDPNGTPRALFQPSEETIVWSWDNTDFGLGRIYGPVKFNLRFPGQYYDELTGLNYNLNRYYNPELGRYMEPDPIGLEGGLNPYIYADNNPISNIDPSGLDCIGGTCSSGFEQGMYDWWPGYKFGTGLYNSFSSGSNQFTFWEGFDGVASLGGLLGKGLQYSRATMSGTGAYLQGAESTGAGLGLFSDRAVKVSQKGIDIMEKHLSQFGTVRENQMMISRINTAFANGEKLRGADAIFYTHEIAEATMMGKGLNYSVAHSTALSKYQVSPFSVYHPEVIARLPEDFGPKWFQFWGITKK